MADMATMEEEEVVIMAIIHPIILVAENHAQVMIIGIIIIPALMTRANMYAILIFFVSLCLLLAYTFCIVIFILFLFGL